MEKTLFKNKEEFDSFIDGNTGLYVPNHGTVRRWSWAEEPKEYPCIAVWEIQYNGNGPICWNMNLFILMILKYENPIQITAN